MHLWIMVSIIHRHKHSDGRKEAYVIMLPLTLGSINIQILGIHGFVDTMVARRPSGQYISVSKSDLLRSLWGSLECSKFHCAKLHAI